MRVACRAREEGGKKAMQWYEDDHMGWMGGWMGIWWLLLVSVLIGLVLWALARSARNSHARSESPEDILKRRYASGEIGRETYQQMLIEVKEPGRQSHAS